MRGESFDVLIRRSLNFEAKTFFTDTKKEAFFATFLKLKVMKGTKSEKDFDDAFAGFQLDFKKIPVWCLSVERTTAAARLLR